jgi:hypothetical protein
MVIMWVHLQIHLKCRDNQMLQRILSWNAIPAGGSLKKFERTGAIYTEVTVPAKP